VVGQIRTLQVIGIGVGDPQYLTVGAIAALNSTDVFFFIDKPNATGDLAQLRDQLCRQFIVDHPYRIVHADEVERDRGAQQYGAAVADWHERRAELYERLIRDELSADSVGALLVWGDPTLYDGTLRILDRVSARGVVEFEYSVIPGISSVQALTARHQVAMNRIGESVQITTGRRIAQRERIDNTFVMLDAEFVAAEIDDSDLDIYWGAYLGTAEEVLIAGPLGEVSETIRRTRTELRAKHGWIMDTYLLRRR